jgi:predicted lipid-binding transport protein (Tim44 family)
MGDSFNILNLILLAVAVGIFLKLRSVLGRRTGTEQPPFDPYAAPDKTTAGGKVITLPKRPQTAARPGEEEGAIDAYPNREPYVVKDSLGGLVKPDSTLGHILTEMALVDRTFDAAAFLSGAKVAYEMIVTAFAKGDSSTLKNLLDPAVFASFDAAIKARTEKGETIEQSFIGIERAELTDAALEGTVARITIRFASELTSSTKNKDGVVVEGDPVTIRHVTDVWTFERDLKSRDPNWRLVATSASN